MIAVLIKGTVLKVYERKAKSGTAVKMFDVYEKAGGEVVHIEGDGVKENTAFEGAIGIDTMSGVSNGREWHFQVIKRLPDIKL